MTSDNTTPAKETLKNFTICAEETKDGLVFPMSFEELKALIQANIEEIENDPTSAVNKKPAPSHKGSETWSTQATSGFSDTASNFSSSTEDGIMCPDRLDDDKPSVAAKEDTTAHPAYLISLPELYRKQHALRLARSELLTAEEEAKDKQLAEFCGVDPDILVGDRYAISEAGSKFTLFADDSEEEAPVSPRKHMQERLDVSRDFARTWNSSSESASRSDPAAVASDDE
jgi:hypothetical protein